MSWIRNWNDEVTGSAATLMTVRHEHARPDGPSVRNYLTDEGRPLGTGLQE